MKRYRQLFAPILLIAILMTCPNLIQAASVQGFVLHPGTGEGIPNAAVYYGMMFNDNTDDDGFYNIPDLPAGNYAVHILADGFRPYSQGGVAILEGVNEYDYTLSCPARIEADPLTFTFDVPWGGQSSDILTITDIGCDPLNFTLAISYLDEELAGIPGGHFANLEQLRPTIGTTLYDGPPSTDFPEVPSAPHLSELDDPYFLIFLDNVPWYNDYLTLLNEMEIPFDIMGSGAMGTVELDEYTAIVIPSVQSTAFYTTFFVTNGDRFEAWVSDGGWLEFHGCTQFGNDWTTWDGVTEVYQTAQTNVVVEPDHPIMEGVPPTFTGTAASHNYISNYPEDALVIVETDFGQPTLIEYNNGRGTMLICTMTLEFGLHNDQGAGIVLTNMFAYTAENAGGAGRWLMADPRNGTIDPGDNQEVDLQVDAGLADLPEGAYEAIMEIRGDDPDVDTETIWFTLLVGSPGILEGMITDFDTGEGLEGAEIMGFQDGELRRSAFSDEDGHYELHLGTGEYQIAADLVDYYMSDFFDAAVVEGETTTLDIQLHHEIPPDIVLDTEELLFITIPGGSDSDVITMSNQGGLPLDYTVRVDYIDDPGMAGYIIRNGGLFPEQPRVENEPPTLHLPDQSIVQRCDLRSQLHYRKLRHAFTSYRNRENLEPVERNLLAAEGILEPLPVRDEELDYQGGPDEFGYMFWDSDEPNGPEYDWVDISDTGTPVPFANNNIIGPIELPFDFPFYGSLYDEIYIASYGYLRFDNQRPTQVNTNLPNPQEPNGMICMFWDDLFPQWGGIVYQGEDEFGNWVTQWENIPGQVEEGITFECILSPDGTIKLQYQDLGPMQPSSETIGIENLDGTDGLQVSFNNTPPNYPVAELAIEIVNPAFGPGRWLVVDPNHGTLDIDDETELEVQADAGPSELPEGVYEAMIEVSASHPDTDPEVVWVSFIVGAGGIFNPVTPTGLPYPIIIDNVLWDEEAIPFASGIGVFDGDLCVGTATVTGEWPISLIAWEGVEEPMVMPGFTSGNPMTFRLWNSATQEIEDGVAQFTRGDGDFGYPGYSHVTLSNGEQIPRIDLPLQANYFELISTPLMPPDLDAAAVFDIEMLPSLTIAYQNDGGIYLPPFINTIGDIDITQGYQLFCSEAEELTIQGDIMDPETEYDLFSNRWNWMGYPFYNLDVPVETALSDIIDQIVIILTDDGRMFLPPFINTIGDMTPGTGYLVFVSEDMTFQYNSGNLASAPVIPVTEVPVIEGAPQPTGLPYAVLVHLTEELAARNPSMVEIYDGDLLVGKAAVLDDHNLTPVICWQGSVEHDLPGFTPGHSMTVKVANADGALPAAMQTGTFGEGAYTEITLSELNYNSELPTEFTVGNAYPNPFNPSVTIPFALPQAGEASIVAFNLLGQQVFSSQQNYKAGYHNFVFDAASAGQELVSGVYFLRVDFNGQVSTQKVMLLR